MDNLSNQIGSFESIEVEFGDLDSSDDGSWEERYASLKLLVQSDAGDLYKLREMKDALNDSNAAVRYLAANSLKALDCEGVVDALLFALTDSYEWIRIRAIEGLGDRRAVEAVEPFIQYLDKDSNPKVRATLVKHLGRFCELKLVPLIASYLSDDDARVRANAVEGLGFYPPEFVADILRPLKDDDNARIRANVAVALSKGEANVSRGTIDQLLSSPDLYERMGAIYSIGETREETYIPILLQYLNDPSYLVQRNVCDAMIKFGIKLQGILLKEIRTRKTESFLLGSLRVLASIADKKALKTLLKLQETGEGEVREAAERAIDEIYSRAKRLPTHVI
ncbi:MAG: HEAT repeat domain-containing protein [bacterium]|nr:HEAT repeat domain-containing protein [bacterium]